MKKKWIIFGSIGFVILVGVIILLVVILGGNNFNKMSSKVFNSMNNVKTVDAVTTVKEDDVILYQYQKLVEMKDEENAVITINESEYNSSFEFETNTTVEESSINKEDLLMISLGESLFKDIKISKNKLTAYASNDQIKNIFISDQIEISGDAYFEFIFEDELIKDIHILYKLLSGREVSIIISYSY